MIPNEGMPIAFETERLRVFLCQMQPAPHNSTKDVFIAFRTDEDRPLVCATAVVDLPHKFADGSEMRHSIEWAEVTSQYRREGFWTELRKGIEQHYSCPVEGDGATEEGNAFLDSWEARNHGIEKNAN
jgi:hypothetical protein